MINAVLLRQLLDTVPLNEKVVYVGIGTDRNIPDSLGPMVGTMLEERGYKVYGTMEYPMHALSIPHYAKEINSYKCVIAIDACSAVKEKIGSIHFRKKPVRPGAGAGKELPTIGNFSILGMVDGADVMHNIGRLYDTFSMAKDIVDTIERFEQIRKRRINKNRRKKRVYFIRKGECK